MTAEETGEINGALIKKLRVEVLDCTLDQFAMIIGCSPSAVRRWEDDGADKIEKVYCNVLHQLTRAVQLRPGLRTLLQPSFGMGTLRLQYVISGVVYNDSPWVKGSENA